MKALKKLNILTLLATTAFVLASCGNNGGDDPDDPEDPYVVPPITDPYARGDDAELYENALGNYEFYANEAKGIEDDDERFVKYAESEAWLLNSGVFNPTSTDGGIYAMTRIAPRTVPYCDWGNDSDRIMSAVIIGDSGKFIRTEERAEMLELWKAAVAGTGVYDPAGYLTEKGYSLSDSIVRTYSTAPVTLDILNTSERSDTEVLINCIDGLVQYDNLGKMNGNLAVVQPSGLPYELSEDGLTYTFHLRDDAKWYTANGDVYASVVADDFVAAFQHMLDAKSGLEELVEGVIAGVEEYLYDGGSFSDVGVKAVDEHTLTYTLCAKEKFFPTRLTYSIFMPMNRSFFLSKGGAFGITEFAAAKELDTYTYGKVDDAGNMVYNGAFIPNAIVEQSEILLNKNPNYFDATKVRISQAKWVYDDGSNPDATYTAAVAGSYVSISLGVATGLLAKSKADGNFSKYHYVVETTTTTYLCGYNLNRGTFETGEVISTQSNQERTYTHYAMQNIYFRKALQFAWDRKTYNAISVGDELAELSLRNMYTKPDFLVLSKDVTDSYGYTFERGSTYGEMVQHYCDKMLLPIKVDDGIDGWYNPGLALGYMKTAVKQLKSEMKWGGKIKIDVTYYSPSTGQTARANAYKRLIEKVLGKYVEVCLNAATSTASFYACGYRASNGAAGNFDVFYGSGWGPDFGDPSTYLNTFLGGGAGYMTKIIGLF